MKFSFSIKYFIVWIVIVLLSNYSTFLWKTDKETVSKTQEFETVSLWEIKNSIEVVWNAELVDEQSLSFNKAWTITKVNFRAGSKVKKWEVIAEIDNSDAYDSIEDAKISLENSQINLKQLYEKADESKILQARNSITNNQNSLDLAKKELENLKITQDNSLEKLLENIETSKKELENSKSSLDLVKKELETLKKEKQNSLDNTSSNKSTTIQNIEDDFKISLVEIDKIIEESDYIMWVTKANKKKNDDYDDYLWTKDSVIKSKAKKSLLNSISLRYNLKNSLEKYDYSWDKTKILILLEEYLKVFDSLYNTTDLIYQTLENSIVNIYFTQNEIDSLKNTISWYRKTTLSEISLINKTINTLETLSDTDLISESNINTFSSKEESIKNQELSIEKKEIEIKNSIKNYDETKIKYDLNIETKQKDIDNKTKSLEISKISLEELLEWPTTSNVKKANNSIKQAKIKLSSAYENLEDYVLESPFDWVIRKIDYMPWDNLTNDTDKYVYIENPNLLEISVMLDQIDITKVDLNSKAIIKFDAYISWIQPWNAIFRKF